VNRAQRIFARLALTLVAPVLALPAHAADQCYTCHQGLGDKASSAFGKDVHHRHGITCAGCHGGDAASEDMERAMSKEAGFIGVPHGDAISAMCASCHADSVRMRGFGSSLPTNQFALLQGSVHGGLSTTGKGRIAQCITCHGAHGILPRSDPASPVNPRNVVATCTSCHNNAAFMRSYNPKLPVDQLEKYRTSVHGIRNAAGDPLVAECASCHGSHEILAAKNPKSRVYPLNLPRVCSSCHSDAARMKAYGIPTDQFEKYARSVHGIALLEKRDLAAPACNGCHGNHGATPPGVESISRVCGTCHALNADLFSASPHKQAFDARHLPECETCHGNHEIPAPTTRMLGTDSASVCARCHTPADTHDGFRTAGAMRTQIDSLEAGETTARALVEDAEQKGMEIGEAKYRLRDARQARLEARTMVHSFDRDRFAGVVHKGLATTGGVAAEASQAIDEYYFRRIGLGVATLIITILALALYQFIRRIERRQATERRTPHS
jgi:predicted CXXCH cytochrome family protein